MSKENTLKPIAVFFPTAEEKAPCDAMAFHQTHTKRLRHSATSLQPRRPRFSSLAEEGSDKLREEVLVSCETAASQLATYLYRRSYFRHAEFETDIWPQLVLRSRRRQWESTVANGMLSDMSPRCKQSNSSSHHPANLTHSYAAS